MRRLDLLRPALHESGVLDPVAAVAVPDPECERERGNRKLEERGAGEAPGRRGAPLTNRGQRQGGMGVEEVAAWRQCHGHRGERD